MGYKIHIELVQKEVKAAHIIRLTLLTSSCDNQYNLFSQMDRWMRGQKSHVICQTCFNQKPNELIIAPLSIIYYLFHNLKVAAGTINHPNSCVNVLICQPVELKSYAMDKGLSHYIVVHINPISEYFKTYKFQELESSTRHKNSVYLTDITCFCKLACNVYRYPPDKGITNVQYSQNLSYLQILKIHIL